MRGKKFSVNTMPTKEAVVSSLTRDATIEACIYDLVDNSIDAARDLLFGEAKEVELDRFGLPSSYAPYEIKLRIGAEGVAIEDNCGGIDPQSFSDGALKFGEKSVRRLGIGVFGVGLNRAIFRLGQKARISTDDGKNRAVLTMDAVAYLKSKKWELDAMSLPSVGKRGTTVEVGSPVTDVARSISDDSWVELLKADLAARYFTFLQKGLVLQVNGDDLNPSFVKIRKGGPYKGFSKSYKAGNGVCVYIEGGQHFRHRFSAEADFDFSTNRNISDEFGWSIICNDRLIVRSDKSPRTGWDKQWHPEFNGFVGYVYFVSETPDLLPWNTTKLDVDQSNSIYRDALDDMRGFVKAWRHDAYHAKKVRKEGGTLAGGPTSTSGAGASEETGPKGGETKRPEKVIAGTKPTKRSKKTDHNSLTTILPDDIDQKFCRDKLLALVNEAQSLDLLAAPYAGMGLLRSLFETAAILYLTRHRRYDDLIAACADAASQSGRPMTEKQRKNFVPRLEDILTFFANNKDVWGSERANYLERSAASFAQKKTQLNDAIHNPYHTINRQEALAIRDSTLPVLRHMIEK